MLLQNVAAKLTIISGKPFWRYCLQFICGQETSFLFLTHRDKTLLCSEMLAIVQFNTYWEAQAVGSIRRLYLSLHPSKKTHQKQTWVEGHFS